jgi:hypothetical protein
MTNKLKKFIEYSRERVRVNYDLVIAFAGIDPGVGKSTLAIMTGMGIDDSFDLEKNIAYIPRFDHIEKQFKGFPKYSYFLIDEAIKVLYKLRWMDKLQQSLNEMYDLERKRNICTALCIPRFIDLNEHFRNYRVKLWVQLVARGIAVVYARDTDPHTTDPWHIKENYEMKRDTWYKRGKKIADIDIEERLDMERRTINYLMDFRFDPLDPVIEQKYLDILQKKKEEFDAMRSQEDQEAEEGRIPKSVRKTREQLKITIINLTKSGLSAKEISRIIPYVPLDRIYKTLQEAGIKPTKKPYETVNEEEDRLENEEREKKLLKS